MNRRAEIKLQYKEIKPEAGVYQIRNTQNDKRLVASTLNLKTINGKTFSLRQGSHVNKSLQQEWNEYGEGAFAVEVLEVLKRKEQGYFDPADALEKLEAKWIEQLQPFGERGYNGKKP
ncbi:GIY-YIG nuclease family protein [Brevibacillus fluminis]|uniref:GIY-YIG nuclease family protein n=1 Tax=Brevibacillus fluminis TaxID=511487 RepID=UPI003F888FDD